MGWFDWLLGKTRVKSYITSTKSGSTYQIEQREKEYFLHKGSKVYRIISFGSEKAESISELGEKQIGKPIWFQSEKGTGSTTAVRSITRTE